MGQKTHPHGFRLGIVKDWKSRWYAEDNFPELLQEDETIRKYLHRRLAHAAVATVEIERKPSKIVITIHTGRPGVVIGKRGSEVDKLRDELQVITDSEVSINVEEVKRPEVNAALVADNIAHQIRQRISFRRAMRRAVQKLRGGAGAPAHAPGRHRLPLAHGQDDVRHRGREVLDLQGRGQGGAPREDVLHRRPRRMKKRPESRGSGSILHLLVPHRF